MIRYLLKNNVKLMIRNKWILLTMALGPILVVALLSSAFEDMMKSYEGVKEFEVGYHVAKDSAFALYIDEMIEAGAENGITFLEFPAEDIENMIRNNKLSGFVTFEKEDYTVYETADAEIEGMSLEYFLSQTVKAAKSQILGEQFDIEDKEITLPITELKYMPQVESKDYYGIIEIVYFLFLGILFAAPVIVSEQKNGIEKKYQVSPVSGWKLYLGKWIPVVVTTTVGTLLAVLVTTVVYDIPWGNPFISGLVLFLAIAASTSFGIMIYYIFQNLAITVIVLFTSIWFMGFFGGSFETYMYSAFSETWKSTSLIYHINRTLVEYSCMGESSYLGSCIVYSITMAVLCSLIALLIQAVRKGGKR